MSYRCSCSELATYVKCLFSLNENLYQGSVESSEWWKLIRHWVAHSSSETGKSHFQPASAAPDPLPYWYPVPPAAHSLTVRAQHGALLHKRHV